MKEFSKVKDAWGESVIYVKECERFEYEIQPDIPLLNRKHKVYVTTIHLPKKEDFVKMYSAENYYKDSGRIDT